MEAKKKSESEKMKDLTKHEEKFFEEMLEIEDLLEENPTESYK